MTRKCLRLARRRTHPWYLVTVLKAYPAMARAVWFWPIDERNRNERRGIGIRREGCYHGEGAPRGSPSRCGEYDSFEIVTDRCRLPRQEESGHAGREGNIAETKRRQRKVERSSSTTVETRAAATAKGVVLRAISSSFANNATPCMEDRE